MPLFMTQYEGPDSIFTVNKPKAKKNVYVEKAEEGKKEEVEPNIKNVNPKEHKKNFDELMKKLKLIVAGIETVLTAYSNVLSTYEKASEEFDRRIEAGEDVDESERPHISDYLTLQINNMIQSITSNELDSLILLDNILKFNPIEKEKLGKIYNILFKFFNDDNEASMVLFRVNLDNNTQFIETTEDLLFELDAIVNEGRGKAKLTQTPPTEQEELLGLHNELGAEFGGAGIRCRKYGGEMNHDLYIDTKYLL